MFIASAAALVVGLLLVLVVHSAFLKLVGLAAVVVGGYLVYRHFFAAPAALVSIEKAVLDAVAPTEKTVQTIVTDAEKAIVDAEKAVVGRFHPTSTITPPAASTAAKADLPDATLQVPLPVPVAPIPVPAIPPLPTSPLASTAAPTAAASTTVTPAPAPAASAADAAPASSTSSTSSK